MELHLDWLDQVRAVDLPHLMSHPAPGQEMEAPASRGFFFFGGFAAIGVLVAILYSLGLPGALVLDDWGNLQAVIGGDGRIASLWEASFSNPSGLLRRPLANFTLALNITATGLDVAALKATNIVMHLSATGAVGLLAWRLLPHLAPDLDEVHRRWATLLIAAIWAIHPLQVSTVLYVVQRMAILSALFSCLAIASIINAGQNTRLTSTVPIAAFFLFGSLAIAGKESGAQLPLLAGAVLVTAPTALAAPRIRAFCVLLPSVAGCVAVLLLWERLTEGYGSRDFTMGERLITQPYVLASYLRDILIPSPSGLGLFRDDITIRDPSDPMSWPLPVIAGLLFLLTLRLRKRFPLAAFAAAWFVACHLMESTFLPLEMAFEHRNYLALFGPALALGAGATRLLASPHFHGSRLAHLVWLLPAGALALITAQRAESWSTEAKLAAIEVGNRPDSLRANNLAAIVERRNGDTLSPAVRMRRMQELYPDQFFPWAAEMDLACDFVAGRPVPWATIARTAANAPQSDEVLGYFNHIALKIIAGQCRGIDASTLDQQLAKLASTLELDGSIAGAQYLTVLRASLVENHDNQSARRLYRAALALDENPDMLLRAARFEATKGDREVAHAHLARFRTLAPTDQRSTEIQMLLNDASTD